LKAIGANENLALAPDVHKRLAKIETLQIPSKRNQAQIYHRI